MMDVIQLMAEKSSLQYPLNDTVCSGIATTEIKHSRNFLNNICESVFKDRIQGLVYKGLHMTSPEHAVSLMGNNSGFEGFDVTRSDIYGVRVEFEYTVADGTVHKLGRSFFMSSVDDSGLMYLSGGLYNVAPVLFDKCLSPSNHNVFIRLYRDKSRVERRVYKVVHNRTTIQGSVVYLHPNIRDNVTGLCNSPDAAVFLYLFITFGYAETMRRVLGYVPEIVHAADKEEEGYLYYYSNELRGEVQKYRNKFKDYKPTKLAIRVKKELVTDKLKLVSAVVNTMYAIDHTQGLNIGDMENSQVWSVTLSNILLGNKFSVQERLSRLEKHLNSLSELVDVFMAKRFELEFGTSLDQYGNVERDGFYGILLIIYLNFDKWSRASNYITASCYDKRIECMYGLHYRTIVSINQLATKLKKVTYGVEHTMKKFLNQGLTSGHVFKIRKSDAPISALEPVAVVSDNKMFGLSTSMTLQLNLKSSSGKPGKSNGKIADGSTLLSPSHSIGGTTNGLSKGKVSPLCRLNLFAPIKDGTIVPCARLLASTKKLEEIVSRTSRQPQAADIPEEFNITHVN